MSTLETGSIYHTVLLYTLSEPGEWTDTDIIEDLPELGLAQVRAAIGELVHAGLLHVNSTDQHLWPTAAGKNFFRQAV